MTEASQFKLVNYYWVFLGILLAGLVSVLAVPTSWSQIHPELRSEIEFFAFFGYMLVSYSLWGLIAILVNWIQHEIPMFGNATLFRINIIKAQYLVPWWAVHIVFSLLAGLLHLLVDTLMLWWVFSANFEFFPAYLQKLSRWLPFEILAWWACLGIFTVFANHKLSKNKERRFLTHFSVKEDGQTHIISTQEVDSIESCDNYVLLHNANQHYFLKETMNRLEQQLDPSQFLRVHRSAIVNLNKVKTLGKDQKGNSFLKLNNGKVIPVSRRYKPELKTVFQST